jgi:thiol-disulfide isomerase/thioredoxin
MRTLLSQRMFQALLLLFLFAVVSFCGLTVLAATPLTPDLPAELMKNVEDPGDKLVLLDFYSPACGVCIKMEPHLEQIQEKLDKKIAFVRVDVSEQANRGYVRQYAVNGTPTYILFNAQGKPLYKMADTISSSVLKLQLLRFSNQLKKIELPPHITDAQTGQSNGKSVLLAFGDENCEACTRIAPYLKAFEGAAEGKLSVIQLNTDHENNKRFYKTLGSQKMPFYVVMDSTGQELFRYEGEIQPKVLWKIIHTLTNSGV